jgi:cbb3-type cytochrome oxidase subunit 1
MKGSKEKKMATSAVLMGVLVSFQLMFPNGLMPPMVRFGHFAELFGEMLIFGALCAWMVVADDKKE